MENGDGARRRDTAEWTDAGIGQGRGVRRVWRGHVRTSLSLRDHVRRMRERLRGRKPRTDAGSFARVRRHPVTPSSRPAGVPVARPFAPISGDRHFSYQTVLLTPDLVLLSDGI